MCHLLFPHPTHPGPTLTFLSDEITVQEGEDGFAFIQLVMTDVPTNGLEGVIEYAILVSSAGASKC